MIARMPQRGPQRSRRGELRVFEDERGALTLTEFDSLPFAPARAYVLHGIPRGARRGGHAHREQQRFLAIVSGRASVVHDDGVEAHRFEIGAGESLHVPSGVWHELEALDDDLVVMVFASGAHDPRDYVHWREELALLNTAHT
jgi:dTDP-4-dehydrorhamnose 3,5-epimerase-like enzyme